VSPDAACNHVLAVRAFVSSHIKRVVEQMDRCNQLRLATDASDADDEKS
jgi:hypothetical protein